MCLCVSILDDYDFLWHRSSIITHESDSDGGSGINLFAWCFNTMWKHLRTFNAWFILRTHIANQWKRMNFIWIFYKTRTFTIRFPNECAMGPSHKLAMCSYGAMGCVCVCSCSFFPSLDHGALSLCDIINIWSSMVFCFVLLFTIVIVLLFHLNSVLELLLLFKDLSLSCAWCVYDAVRMWTEHQSTDVN